MAIWTEEQEEQLVKLNREGLSAKAIGDRMGFPRNAILGKLHRLGIKKNTFGPRGTHRLALPLKPSGKLCNIRSSYIPKPKQTRTPPKPPVETVSVPAISASLQVALLDLTQSMCRWPIGDPRDDLFHFCGHAKVPGLSYCEHHALKAFQPAAVRRRLNETAGMNVRRAAA